MKDTIHDLKDIPNEHGFSFIGVKRDGSEVDCYVHNTIDSGHVVMTCYTLKRINGDLVGWKKYYGEPQC